MGALIFDEVDQVILDGIIPRRDAFEGPREGDFVVFPTGEIERFSHDWKDSLQTSPIWAGSFYLHHSGGTSFSGSLNPSIPLDSIQRTDEMKDGTFWFFHHNEAGASRGVRFSIPCRVYNTLAQYRGFVSRL